jgi:hypothetical protein
MCTIVDDSDKKNGKYYVTNGSTKFLAYCDTDKYRNNEQVRVLIPKGDYTKEKFIVGKYVNDNSDIPITYISPLETIVEIESFEVPQGENNQYGIPAEDCLVLTKKVIWSTMLEQEKYINTIDGIHTTVTLQADFKTFFNGYDLISG